MQSEILLMGTNNEEAKGAFIALNYEIPQGDEPEWIELIPAGNHVLGRDGRKWLNDSPQDVVAAFNASGCDVVFDIEHSTEKKAPLGEPAPAVGWINALELRDGAVWGRVAWNAEGQEAIANRQYRYYSPAFLYEKASLRIRKLSSVALTNQPNLRLKALNQQQRQEENNMFEKILKALGLAENATEEQALNAISTLQSDLATAVNRANTPDLAKFVPRADYDQVLERATNAENKLAAQDKEALDTEIENVVGDALKAGKITPATKDYYTAMCRQENGLEEFKKFVAAAPVIGDPSDLDEKAPKGTKTALNADQQKIADMLGNSTEDIEKYGK